MSPVQNTRRDRRVLAAGLVVIVALIAAGRGLPSLRRWQLQTRDSAAALVQEAAHTREIVARARPTRDSLSARRQRFLALAPLLLRGETPAMGSATLASLVATAASAASVRLGPVQVRSDTAARGVFSRVGARAEVTGDVRGVGAFLGILERGPTLVAVRELAISQLEPGAPPDRAEVLRVQLAVEALMLAPRRAATPAKARVRNPGERKP